MQSGLGTALHTPVATQLALLYSIIEYELCVG
jgi:hypothetical protein